MTSERAGKTLEAVSGHRRADYAFRRNAATVGPPSVFAVMEVYGEILKWLYARDSREELLERLSSVEAENEPAVENHN